MLQDADTMLEIYSGNQIWFTQFNGAIFNEEYLTDFKNLINSARKSRRDVLIKDEQAEKSAMLEEVMKRCRDHYRFIRFLAEKAFPGNKTIHNQFGFSQYSSVRRSAEKMKLFYEGLIKVIEKYESELLVAGAPADLRAATTGLVDELIGAIKEQQAFIKYRPEVTDARIKHLNAVWDRMREIYSASRIIFKDDPTKLRLFELRNKTEQIKPDRINVEEQPEGVLEEIDEETTF